MAAQSSVRPAARTVGPREGRRPREPGLAATPAAAAAAARLASWERAGPGTPPLLFLPSLPLSSEMTAPGAAAGAAPVLVALVAAALCGHQPLLGVSATLNSVLNSNAIKNLPPPLGGASGHPGSAVSVAPGILFDGANKYQTMDNYQVRRRAGGPGGRRRRDPGEVASGRKGVRTCGAEGTSGSFGDLLWGPWAAWRWERGGQKRAAMRLRVRAGGHLDAQEPHPLAAPFPQPYPCAEDEECGTDEYCASPARGGGSGAQVCLACRKRRKRCMRHAMCCPGNYCKNGECLGSLWTARTVPPLLTCGWEDAGSALSRLRGR